jgi:hypothetical protein
VTLIQEKEGGDAVDLGGQEDFLAGFRNNMPSTGAGFHPLINTKKMNVVLDA